MTPKDVTNSVFETRWTPLTLSCALSVLGAVVLIVGLAVTPRAVAASYLVAYAAVVGSVTGMLLLIMMTHLSGGIWFVVLRPRAESVVASLPALAVLTLPLLLVPAAFWPWAAPLDSLPSSTQEAIRSKLPYLDQWFFTLRMLAYWGVWLAVAELLRQFSRRKAAEGADRLPHGIRTLSAVGIPLVGLAVTFAAIDWLMSVAPEWSSSIYGPYFFAGAMVSALAALAVIPSSAAAPGRFVTAEHFHALGRLTLAFVLFWGYLWYSQFFIIWIANIPREAAWYVERFNGGWGILGRVVVVSGFALPVALLLVRAAKRSSFVLAGLGVWLLIIHYMDVYWLVVPSIRPEWSVTDGLWDVGALAFLAGSAATVAIWRERDASAVRMADPLLERSMRYEAH